MAASPARSLLPLTGAYLVVVVLGVILTFVYDVGASAEGDPGSDVAFRGTALAAPLPARDPRRGRGARAQGR